MTLRITNFLIHSWPAATAVHLVLKTTQRYGATHVGILNVTDVGLSSSSKLIAEDTWCRDFILDAERAAT